MNKIKVITIFGTRPEAIKMAPLVKELESREEIDSKICVTAQHREMLDQVLDLFSIKPDFDLNIMKNKQTLTSITTGVLEGLKDIFEQEKPDLILVHGDTTRSEEHTSELQSRQYIVCRLLLEKKTQLNPIF